MPDTKNIIEKFEDKFCNNHQRPIRFLRSIFYDEQDGAEEIEQFILTELQALKEECVGEEWKQDFAKDEYNDLLEIRTGYNQHRKHTIEAFERFGIK